MAVATAGLTVYDMCKSVDKGMHIDSVGWFANWVGEAVITILRKHVVFTAEFSKLQEFSEFVRPFALRMSICTMELADQLCDRPCSTGARNKANSTGERGGALGDALVKLVLFGGAFPLWRRLPCL